MANAPAANALITVPSGTGVGTSTALRSVQASGFAASPQVARLTPHASSAPTLPRKLPRRALALTKSALARLPVLTRVGRVRSHHLKPVTGLPLPSMPLALVAA